MPEQNRGSDNFFDQNEDSEFSGNAETPENLDHDSLDPENLDHDNLDVEIPGDEQMEEMEEAEEELQEMFYESDLPGEEDIDDDPFDI